MFDFQNLTEFELGLNDLEQARKAADRVASQTEIAKKRTRDAVERSSEKIRQRTAA